MHPEVRNDWNGLSSLYIFAFFCLRSSRPKRNCSTITVFFSVFSFLFFFFFAFSATFFLHFDLNPFVDDQLI